MIVGQPFGHGFYYLLPYILILIQPINNKSTHPLKQQANSAQPPESRTNGLIFCELAAEPEQNYGSRVTQSLSCSCLTRQSGAVPTFKNCSSQFHRTLLLCN